MDLFRYHTVNGKRIPKEISLYISEIAGYQRCSECQLLYGPTHLFLGKCWHCSVPSDCWLSFQISYAELYDLTPEDCNHYTVPYMPEWAQRNEIWTLPTYIKVLLAYKELAKVPEEILPYRFLVWASLKLLEEHKCECDECQFICKD